MSWNPHDLPRITHESFLFTSSLGPSRSRPEAKARQDVARRAGRRHAEGDAPFFLRPGLHIVGLTISSGYTGYYIDNIY